MPGCFVDWNFDLRTPHKKFCSSLCDNALRAACARVERYYKARGSIGRITSANRMNVLLAKPGSRAQLRGFRVRRLTLLSQMDRRSCVRGSNWFQKRERPLAMPLPTTSPAGNWVRCLHLSDFDLRFDRYRLIQPKADLLMARSLAKYDQLAPVVYCQLEGSLVLVDGFKRLRASRTLTYIPCAECH